MSESCCSIELMFTKIGNLINNEELDKQDVCLILHWLEKIAGEFQLSDNLLADKFHQKWLAVKPRFQAIASSYNFDQRAVSLEIKLTEILEPAKWPSFTKARQSGNLEGTICLVFYHLSTVQIPLTS